MRSERLDLLAPRKALLVAGANAHSRYYSEDVRAKAPEAVDLYDRKDLIPFGEGVRGTTRSSPTTRRCRWIGP